eukprot:645178-Pleurochrysis_carterae.AAC.1
MVVVEKAAEVKAVERVVEVTEVAARVEGARVEAVKVAATGAVEQVVEARAVGEPEEAAKAEGAWVEAMEVEEMEGVARVEARAAEMEEAMEGTGTAGCNHYSRVRRRRERSPRQNRRRHLQPEATLINEDAHPDKQIRLPWLTVLRERYHGRNGSKAP